MNIIKQAYKNKQPKTKKIWVCTKCGSSNVQYKSWVNANTGKCTDGMINVDEDDCWCKDCEIHAEIKLVELKADAHVIGFQVVGIDGSCNEGSIHPEMLDAKSIYCLSQANVILNIKTLNPNKIGYNKDWRLLAIWNNEIENPNMMYLGSNPRD